MKIKSFRSSLLTVTLSAFALVGLTAFADQGIQLVQPQPRATPTPILAQSAGASQYYAPFTNTVCTANTSATNTFAIGTPGMPLPSLIPVVPGTILAVQYSLYASGAGNSNCVLQFAKTIDNQTLESTASLSCTNSCNGTTTTNTYVSIIGTNILARSVALTGFGSSQTNPVTLTNLVPIYIPVF